MATAEAQAKKTMASSIDADAEPIIRIIGMHKWYGQFHVLKNLNLDVKPRERIVICGAPGSGKSTMIRCINRLEEHQQGQIIVDGHELGTSSQNLDAVRREVGIVFQHFNLFPHMSILENCTYGPIWVLHMPKKEAEERAMHFLERVRIPEQAEKRPGQQLLITVYGAGYTFDVPADKACKFIIKDKLTGGSHERLFKTRPDLSV